MSDVTDLKLAVGYLTDIEAELEVRAIDSIPRARSASREDMRHQLNQVRALIAGLEQRDPNVTCPHELDGREVIVDLEEARIWCHVIEAKIMGICYGDPQSGATWMERAIALNPARPRNHALLSIFLSEAGEHERAIEAATRAVSLQPDDLNYRKVLDTARRLNQPTPDPTPDYPWWHVGRYRS